MPLVAEGAAAASWEPPAEFGGFRILESLGQGGMGKVYLAREQALDRLVALKFMLAPAAARSSLDRFRSEAQALARLTHPNVVGVYRIDQSPDGHPFIAYEYVAGQSLDRVLLPVRWQTALAILTMVARALGAAHAAGIVHRDVKPGNVMITPTGDVKLLDFGLAIASEGEVASQSASVVHAVARAGRAELAAGGRLTALGFAVGTPRYWSPEQWRGAPVTAATDVYALGLIAYEMLTGRPPYAELAGPNLGAELVAQEVPPLDASLAPQALLDVVAHCLRRDPAERYASGSEVVVPLEHIESVFLTRGRAEAQIGSDEDLVAVSWERACEAGVKLVERVYARLFEDEPSLRELLPKDLGAQQAKLFHALDLTIRGLHHPEQITTMLRELGQRHIAYRVEPWHLDVFGRALRRGLSEIDPLWNERVDAAWEHAYRFIAASMRVGMLAPLPAPSPTPVPIARTPTPSPFQQPNTAYARVAGSSIAYQVFGSGPPQLILLPGAMTHIEATWTHPSAVTLLTGLARFARVVMFDQRGCGLSDPLDGPPQVEDLVTDTLAVAAAAKMERVILVAGSAAAFAALRFAARYPQRVTALVLVGAAARWSAAADFPQGRMPSFWQNVQSWIEAHWGESRLAERLAPSACLDPSFDAWLAAYLRLASSPRRAVGVLHCARDADERAYLTQIRVPTLMIHRKGDQVVPIEWGRQLAASIPGSTLVEIDGDDHFIFAGDTRALAVEIERFVAVVCPTELANAPGPR